MRKLASVLVAIGLTTTTAVAADPTGEWLVQDKDAKVKIENCRGAYWGVISWEKDPGGVDSKNPDTAKRGRPTLGLPIILAMKPNGSKWEGQIYDPNRGSTWTANIALASADVLEVKGCLGPICLGQKWTRQKENTGAAPPPPGAPGARKTSATPASRSICSAPDIAKS